MAGYPKELIAKAKFELRVFDRVSRDTGAELLAEVEAWRARFPEYEHRAPDACVALREPAEKPGPDFLHPPEAEASGPSSTPVHDMVKGGWVATSDGPSGIGFVPRIARVREVHDDGLLDLVLYSFTGERIGRESPAMGGPAGFEPCCAPVFWEPIERPDFNKLSGLRSSYGFHLQWKRPQAWQESGPDCRSGLVPSEMAGSLKPGAVAAGQSPD